MALVIKWSSELSVRVAEIDQQHQKLIDMINDLNDAMSKGKGKEITAKIIEGLLSYTATHFALEEKYFTLYGYPEAGIHKIEHKNFVKKVTEFKDSFNKGAVLLTFDIITFLKDWLVKHIQGTDKKYTKFFNEKGLK